MSIQQRKTYPLWVSHTSMRDFLNCPRAYFLRNIYKDPKTGKKINIINPALALGNTVHDVLEELSELKSEDRFRVNLIEKYEAAWQRMAGELGGFRDIEEETVFKQRGEKMIKRVMENPGPLLNKALKLRSIDSLPPRYLISPKENILLCGKIDWLEYFPEDDSVHIIDFKTGLHEEEIDSLQLPIYTLLVRNCQKRNIKKISYWYLESSNKPVEMPMPDIETAHKRVMEIAMQVKDLRKKGIFECKRENGCFACRPLEKIVNGEAKYIKTSGYQDIYVVN
jgi:ATP-dependent helicase/DNAse subunit B